MKPAMYIFLNRGLGMSSGKLAAQASHAAVEAYLISDPEILKEWFRGGHYAKLTMLALSSEDMYNKERYLNERGVKTKLIIDEGLTEIAAHQPTALGCEVVDRDDPDIKAIFSSFELYRDKARIIVEVDK